MPASFKTLYCPMTPNPIIKSWNKTRARKIVTTLMLKEQLFVLVLHSFALKIDTTIPGDSGQEQ